jgi:hypothetical protein
MTDRNQPAHQPAPGPGTAEARVEDTARQSSPRPPRHSDCENARPAAQRPDTEAAAQRPDTEAAGQGTDSKAARALPDGEAIAELGDQVGGPA